MASSIYPLLILILFCILTTTQVSGGQLLLEEGYTVSTILDGNKLHFTPHSILPQFGSSDLILLDSTSSTFYTLSFRNPQDIVIKRIAGNGVEGYADGELGSAMFHKPNNFAVDFKGNLYVADKFNHVIRKISKSGGTWGGVTTIAGGYSQKTGKKDGPAQNASFSNQFELVFIPNRCALLISDHSNSLVRQINLKEEDCSHGSQSVMGMASAWALGLGLSCLLGVVIGFVIRPYVTKHGGLIHLPCNKTWKHCLISLERQIKTVEPKTSRKEPPSLLDCDDLKDSDKIRWQVDQLMNLISFDEGVVSSDDANKNIQQKDNASETTDVSTTSDDNVDRLIQANVMGFMEQARNSSVAEPLQFSMGLVKSKYN